jgi:pyruvate ferredoxin oxidoreductase gamma subunit
MISLKIVMIEIRIHGRGGQGAVTAARILAIAYFYEGYYSQAFPFFGVERRGAPVEAYCRVSNEKILTREHVYNPDYVLVLDNSLSKEIIEKGTTNETKFFYNSTENKENCFDATSLALEILGKPIVNTSMVAFFAKNVGIKKESIIKALEEMFEGSILEKNRKIVERIYGD